MNTKKSNKHKIVWDLKHLYKSPIDPQMEKDIVEVEKAIKRFVNKYTKNQDYLKSPIALRKAFDEEEKIGVMPGSIKPMRFLYLSKDAGDTSPIIDKKMNLLIDRLTKLSNTTLFFSLKLGKVSKEIQKKFLKSKELEPFKYQLEKFFESSKYDLSEPEEKIINLLSNPSGGMWIDGVEKSLNKKTVLHKGKEIPLPEASGIYSELPAKERRGLFNKMMLKQKEIGDFAESEINALYTKKKISDELRGLKKPYSATLIGHETDEEQVEAFVDLITKNFPIAHSFYDLKKKILGLKELTYADRGAKIGKINKKFDFETSAKILLNAFNKVDPQFHNILKSYLEKGQIDVFPKKGKTGGAYCSSSSAVPTVVLLNHTNDFNSVNTFAHEMGHAIHSELAEEQPYHYQGYSTAVAETASTFFENFVFEALFEKLSDKEKIIALHDKIQGSISTIFRQVAVFNFELELHNTIRSQGYVDQDEIVSMMNKHMKSYCGKSMVFTPLDGYFFVGWSHIRNPFYVYSYAFGELISSALYAEYTKDPVHIEKIKNFMKAGSSKSPRDIFKDTGIDINDMDFFKKGLESIKKDIAQLKDLTK